jgi:serine protease AprX
MDFNKIQPRLAKELVAKKKRGRTMGLSSSRIEEEKLTVSIMHTDRLETKEIESRDEDEDQDNRQRILRELESNFDNIQNTLISKLEQVGEGQTYKRSVLSNSVVIDLTSKQIDAMSEIGSVKLISLEALEKVTTMNESVDVIQVPDVWNDLKLTGKGVKVAILDSGVDNTHSALQGRVVDNVDTTGTGLDPGDHGTHVAGTVASNDSVYRGVAPDADVINVKVLTSGGSGEPQWVIDGIQQAVSRGARVISLSLGWSLLYHGWTCDDGDCILCRAADTASKLGTNMVIAAGNEDTENQNPGIPPGLTNIRCPGNARHAITVGAVDKSKLPANFSSTGPGTARLDPASPIRFIKPDLSAPGVAITSTIPPNSFATFNGTSMATPHVTGVVALLLQKKGRKLSPQRLKNLLKHTSSPAPYPENQIGVGIINAYTAALHLHGYS